MLNKNLLLSMLIAFFFLFGFDFLWHGNLMMGMYEETASVWRTEAEMEKFFPLTVAATLVFAFVVYQGFMKFSKEHDVRAGVKFGAFVAVVVGVVEFMMYFYLPIPMMIAVYWFVGSLIRNTLLGGIYGWTSDRF